MEIKSEIEPEWLDEIDELYWVDKETGLPCFIKRHAELKHLCGYVGSEADWDFLVKIYGGYTVHGGITYGPSLNPPCPPPTNDDLTKYKWVGFDCAHSGDFMPYQLFRYGAYQETYKNIAFVKEQCEQLAKQIKWRQK